MSEPSPNLPVTPSRAESGVIAREIGAAFGRMVRHFREQYGLTPDEARQRAHALTSPEYEEHLLTKTADQVSWHDLDRLSRVNPERAQERWEEVKAAALDELRTGHRAAKLMEAAGSHCWDRAQFMAIRTDLAEEWQPRNGIERHLIDTMAQAQLSYFHWLTNLMARDPRNRR